MYGKQCLRHKSTAAGVWVPPRMRFSVSFVRGTAIEPGMRCRRPRSVEIGIKSSGRKIDSISNQLLFPNQRRLGDRENSEEQNWGGEVASQSLASI